jgi:hypothetical protein
MGTDQARKAQNEDVAMDMGVTKFLINYEKRSRMISNDLDGRKDRLKNDFKGFLAWGKRRN